MGWWGFLNFTNFFFNSEPTFYFSSTFASGSLEWHSVRAVEFFIKKAFKDFSMGNTFNIGPIPMVLLPVVILQR